MDRSVDSSQDQAASSAQVAPSITWLPSYPHSWPRSNPHPHSSDISLSAPLTANRSWRTITARPANIPTISYEQLEYLQYAPTPHSADDRTRCCYRSYLDKLGFKQELDADATEVRLQFIRDLRTHISVPETILLRKEDNPSAFEALVQGFLTTYGPVYWGSHSRGHLVVSDPEKGFLHPRDSLRANSRLVNVMEDLFNYKARTARTNDKHRADNGKGSALLNLDFADLDPSTINMLGKSLVGFGAAFTEIDKMRESVDVEPYDSSEGESEFYDEFGQERYSTQARNTCHTRVTSANTSTGKQHVSEADNKLHRSGSTTIPPPVRKSSRRKRKLNYTLKRSESRHFGSSTAKKRHGSLTSAGVKAGKRRMCRTISRPSPTLSDPAYEYAYAAPHNAAHNPPPGITSNTAHDIAHNPHPAASPTSSGAPKTEILPFAIIDQITLIVTASTQQTLAPVTVSLADYTSTHSDFHNFFDFLAQECELGDLATDVTAISATYTWSGRKHRFRRGKMDVDGRTFVEHLRGAVGGGEVEMLLHVGV